MTDIVERLRLLVPSDPTSSCIDAIKVIECLRAALKSVMVGGNSLAQIIGADHPPHGTPYSEALAHYGNGVKYEAWCCWSAIMQARAALEGK